MWCSTAGRPSPPRSAASRQPPPTFPPAGWAVTDVKNNSTLALKKQYLQSLSCDSLPCLHINCVHFSVSLLLPQIPIRCNIYAETHAESRDVEVYLGFGWWVPQ